MSFILVVCIYILVFIGVLGKVLKLMFDYIYGIIFFDWLFQFWNEEGVDFCWLYCEVSFKVEEVRILVVKVCNMNMIS